MDQKTLDRRKTSCAEVSEKQRAYALHRQEYAIQLERFQEANSSIPLVNRQRRATARTKR